MSNGMSTTTLLEENAASTNGGMDVHCGGGASVAGRNQHDIVGFLPVELLLHVLENLDTTDIIRS